MNYILISKAILVALWDLRTLRKLIIFIKIRETCFLSNETFSFFFELNLGFGELVSNKTCKVLILFQGEIMNEFMQFIVFLPVLHHFALYSIDVAVKLFEIKESFVKDSEGFRKDIFSMLIFVPLSEFSLFYFDDFRN